MHDIDANGARMPALGLGTWMLEGDACAWAVREALELGYRLVDTASAYANEEEVGRGIRASGVGRQEICLVTKVWHEDLAPDRVTRSLEESLRRLGTEYVDVLLIHWPHPTIAWEPALDRMFELTHAGKVRHVGVSNFTSAMMRDAAKRGTIACNQVEYHPYLGQHAVLDAARALGIAVFAYSPLARGKVRDDDTLRQIGHDHGKTPGQVALRWLVQQDRVGAIPKASSREHLAENREIFDFRLSNEEMRLISGLDRNLRLIDPPHAPRWDPPGSPVTA